MPALIVSLAAGLLVSKGGTRGSAEQAVLGQLGAYPRALSAASLMMFVLALMPGLPMAPFVLLGGVMAFVGYSLPRRQAAAAAEARQARKADERAQSEAKEFGQGVAQDRRDRAVARQASVGPSARARATSLPTASARSARSSPSSTASSFPRSSSRTICRSIPRATRSGSTAPVVAHGELRIGEVLVLVDKDGKPDVPGDEVIEPAFGMKALWVTEAFTDEVKRQGCKPVDNLSVLLTHLSEVIRTNLAQLLSYKDMRGAARPARSGIQAPGRRSLPVADLLFGPAGDPEDPAGRAGLDPQSSSDPRGDRRDRAACAALRADRRACAHAHGAADLRRSLRQRRAQRRSASATAGTSPSTRA